MFLTFSLVLLAVFIQNKLHMIDNTESIHGSWTELTVFILQGQKRVILKMNSAAVIKHLNSQNTSVGPDFHSSLL